MLDEWHSSDTNSLSPKLLVITIAACLLGVVLALVGAELPADTSFTQALPFWLTVTFATAFLLTKVSEAISQIVRNIELTPSQAIGLNGVATITLVTLPPALMCVSIDTLLPDSDKPPFPLGVDRTMRPLFPAR